MIIDLFHNKIVKDTVSPLFIESFMEGLVPFFEEKYGDDLVEIQMYEDYLGDGFLCNGEFYYPLTLVFADEVRREWIKWSVPDKKRFKGGELAAYWSEKLGKCEENPVKLEAVIRSKTMKRGGVGYVAPTPESFPTLEEMNKFIVNCGAAPTLAWLNGLSAGENDVDRLFELHLKYGLKAATLIPDRNWRADTPEKQAQLTAELDMFLLTHAGEDAAFAPPFRSDPYSLLKLHKRHPQLQLVLAHGGSWKMWEEVKEVLADLPRDEYRDLVLTLGIENCLFGTDSPWCSQSHALELLHDLELGNYAEEMILAGNAVKLLKI